MAIDGFCGVEIESEKIKSKEIYSHYCEYPLICPEGCMCRECSDIKKHKCDLYHEYRREDGN